MFIEIRKEVLEEHGKPLPFVISTIGVDHEQEPVVRSDGCLHHHLLWVKEGSGVFRVGNQTMILEAGEGLLCRKNVPHAYRSDGVFKTDWLTFLGAEGLLDYCGVGDYLRFRISESAAQAAEALCAVCEGNSTVLSRSAAGYAWLTEFLTELMEPNTQPEQIVRRYMEVHCGEPLTLEEIAEQVHMSKYALCHYYTRTQNMTVMEQLKRIRIAKAKRLLRFTSCPVAEIGQMCGYDSASYFGKQFREETGCTPREYRGTVQAHLTLGNK